MLMLKKEEITNCHFLCGVDGGGKEGGKAGESTVFQAVILSSV